MNTASLARLTLAVLALAVPTTAAAEAGCPLTWSAPPKGPQLQGNPQPDPDVGPFSAAQQRLRSLSFAVEDDGRLAVGVSVDDMRRAVRPGHRWTYWQVIFEVVGRSARASDVQVFYDAVLDEFSTFAYAGGSPGRPEGEVEITLGPGGGWVARFPLSDFKLARGAKLADVRVEAGDFVSYTYMNSDPTSPRTWPSGVYAPRWSMAGPPSVALIGCPDVLLTARDLGNGRGVRMTGDALPAGSGVALEVAEGDGWRALGTVTSGATGAFDLTAALAPGTYTFRALATSPSGTVTTSTPSTAVLTG